VCAIRAKLFRNIISVITALSGLVLAEKDWEEITWKTYQGVAITEIVWDREAQLERRNNPRKGLGAIVPLIDNYCRTINKFREKCP
jgi:hypothetical protein